MIPPGSAKERRLSFSTDKSEKVKNLAGKKDWSLRYLDFLVTRMLDAELNKKVVLKTQLKQDISSIYKNRESKAGYFLPVPSKKLTTKTP